MKIIFAILCGLASLFASEACLQIEGARVHASDIAKALPPFASVPADTVIGYSPGAGLTRWWRGGHLRAIALRHGVDPGLLEDLCVQRPMRMVGREELLASLKAALPEGAELELVDYCRLPVPKGTLSFQQAGLSGSALAGASAPLLWKGRVVFDEKRTVSFWASVKVRMRQEGFFAAQPIPQGKLLEKEDLLWETRMVPFLAPQPVLDLTAVEGLEARRSIPAGAPILIGALNRPRAVEPGQIVQLRIQSGAAQIGAEAKAITGGRIGDSILVMNVQSGKRVKARVQSKGLVTVELEGRDEHLDESKRGVGGRGGSSAVAGPGMGRGSKEGGQAAASAATRPHHSGSGSGTED